MLKIAYCSLILCPTLGESLLHVLIICDTLIHTRVARILLKCFPRLAIDKVEGEEYLGNYLMAL